MARSLYLLIAFVALAAWAGAAAVAASPQATPSAAPQARPAPPKADAAFELTVDSIMRGPGVVGYPPSGLRWSGDSERLYFEWRSRGEDEAATWEVARACLTAAGGSGAAVRACEPRRLSGGQGQLVVLASLLAMRPGQLVLDEPTAQLDPEGTRLVGEALRQLAREGTALLIAEHKTELLDGLCDRVVVLADGAIAADGLAAAILADERLPGWGVDPPGRVRLGRAVRAAG